MTIDPTASRPVFGTHKSTLIAQVSEYHGALREARELLHSVRTACRRLNHPLSLAMIACPHCTAISDLLGDEE